ncbi:LOW QUALITY PROTEIN: dihydrofolate reductase [Streptomyces sp. TLI_235]|nr:LOW QUALITY PROTEIN: dihydrofolate reductase [Streptomyces sp. TLI_235]
MSRLILAMQTSIDGYVDSSLPDAAWQLWNWGPDWPWSEDLRASFNRLLAEASGILLSRPMARDGYLAHWARAAEQHPDDPDRAFARAVGALPKFALSRVGRPAQDWPRTTVLNGELADTVAQAGKLAGGDLVCFGGAGLASALLRADLADELRLFTNPGFAGTGRTIFGPWLATRTYRAATSTAHARGIAETRWVR